MCVICIHSLFFFSFVGLFSSTSVEEKILILTMAGHLCSVPQLNCFHAYARARARAYRACEGENDGTSVAVLLPNVFDEHSGAAEATVHGPEKFPGGFGQ